MLIKLNKEKYKVLQTKTDRYPYVLLLLQNLTTCEAKWWCYTTLYDEELCKKMGVRRLDGCLLDGRPLHGWWVTEEEIDYL